MLFSPLTVLSLPFLAIKKVTEKADLAKLNIDKPKTQNRCGTVLSLSERVDLSTTEHVVDYHTHLGDNNKMVLCLASPQLQNAINTVKATLASENGLTFKPEKGRLYINLTEEQFHVIPMKQKLQLTVSIYGVFTQGHDNLSYLQMKLTAFSHEQQGNKHDIHDNE